MKKITDFINGKVEYDETGQYLWIINNEGCQQMLGEIRGWGAIQNLFRIKDGRIDLDNAGKFQDKIGEFVAIAINEKILRDGKNTP